MTKPPGLTTERYKVKDFSDIAEISQRLVNVVSIISIKMKDKVLYNIL